MRIRSGVAARLAYTVGLATMLTGVAAHAPAQPADKEPDLSYVIVDGASIPDPLSPVTPSVERGEALFEDPEGGGCAECHAAPGIDAAPSRSGPPLDGIGARLSASAIRLWIVNPRARVADSLMPAYYTLDAQAAEPEAADPPPRLGPRLDGAAIEDLVAFLESLK